MTTNRLFNPEGNPKRPHSDVKYLCLQAKGLRAAAVVTEDTDEQKHIMHYSFENGDYYQT